jgi:hypothetical protein
VQGQKNALQGYDCALESPLGLSGDWLGDYD